MKYLLLIYLAEDALNPDERHQCVADSIRLAHDLHANGQYLAASPLDSVSTATTVRVRGEEPIVTDGPFAETREQLGGYFLIDAKDRNEAIAIAAQIPAARKGAIEVRPVTEIAGLPSTLSEK
jgi:hypothetical protein